MADTTSTEQVFADALGMESPTERERFLDDACAGNSVLRHDVSTLLRAHEEAGGFLGESPETIRISTALPRGAEQTAKPVIAGFRIDRQIGRGGLGVVYEAWDEKLHRRVAIKTLHTVPDAEIRRRVLDEARKTAALRDNAIVTVHAVLDEGEAPAIVMELVEGFPLDQFAGGLTFEQRARILQEIARALAAAHRRGIIHRDLKPANVLVTPAMKPVVLDFGLAISLEEGGRLRSRFEGTPLYASPEQASSKALTAA